MADEDEDEPAVELGEGEPVEGAPLARVSARLMWGIEKSALVEREGETTIRTPDGPQELADVLDSVESTYFATRQEFENAVREVIGTGPVPTAGGTDEDDSGDSGSQEGRDDEPAADAGDGESAESESAAE